MSVMLKFELRRALRNPAFYICMAICFIMAFFILSNAWDTIEAHRAYNTSASYVPSLEELLTTAFLTADLGLLIPIFMVPYFCEDYEQDTTKTILSRGQSKRNIFFSKLIISSAVTVLCCLIVTGTCFFGATVFAMSEGIPIKIYRNVTQLNMSDPGLIFILIDYLLSYLALNCYCILVSELIRKTSSSIFASIFGPHLIVQFVYLFLTLFRYAANIKMLDYINLYNYWLPGVLSRIGRGAGADIQTMILMIFFDIFYIFLFAFLALLRTDKKKT